MQAGLIAVAGLAALLVAAPAARADAAAGQAKAAATCAVCHGPQGMAMQPDVPNLAGQSAIYLVEQLRNFRSGKRAHEVMAVIAKPLSNREIDDLAQWYSSLQVTVEPAR